MELSSLVFLLQKVEFRYLHSQYQKRPILLISQSRASADPHGSWYSHQLSSKNPFQNHSSKCSLFSRVLALSPFAPGLCWRRAQLSTVLCIPARFWRANSILTSISMLVRTIIIAILSMGARQTPQQKRSVSNSNNLMARQLEARHSAVLCPSPCAQAAPGRPIPATP